jgi:molybdenum cofactor guanylyltransferase
MAFEDNPDFVRDKGLQGAPDSLPGMTLLLLAGGASRRMGRPKALLPVGGVTLAEWQVERLGGAFAETLVATGPDSPLPPSLEPLRVLDAWPGAGPLAGIDAGLRAATREWVFCLACDLPLASLELARRLAAAAAGHEAAAPRVAGRPHPTCAAYARRAGPHLRRALEGGEHRLARVVGELDVVWVEDVDVRLLTNLNTPADLTSLDGWPPAGERP